MLRLYGLPGCREKVFFVSSEKIRTFAVSYAIKTFSMNTATINSYSADILQGLGAISGNEMALARVAKYVRRVVKEQEKAPALMSEKDFFARVDNGRQQIKDGLGIEMLPNESLSDFLKRVG